MKKKVLALVNPSSNRAILEWTHLDYPDGIADSCLTDAPQCWLLNLHKTAQIHVQINPKRTWVNRSEQDNQTLFFNHYQSPESFLHRVQNTGVIKLEQGIYNRLSNQMQILAHLSDQTLISTHLNCMTTSQLDPITKLMDPIDSLRHPSTPLQVSTGNLGDLPGNFAVLTHDLNGHLDWDIRAAFSEPIIQTGEYPSHTLPTFRACIQLKRSSTHQTYLSEIQLLQQSENDPIVIFQKDPDKPIWTQLNPEEVSCILVASPLKWLSEPTEITVQHAYEPRHDYRHLFRLPYWQDTPVFYHAIIDNEATRQRCWRLQPIQLPLSQYKLTPSIETPDLAFKNVLSGLLQRFGYTLVTSPEAVQYPGQFYLDSDSITWIVLPARYPLNALAIGPDNQKALCEITGLSGRSGANYHTIGHWLSQKIEATFGWQPHAIFALDNGADPTIVGYHNGHISNLPCRIGVNDQQQFTSRRGLFAHSALNFDME